MYFRLPLWVACFVIAAAIPMRGQTPATVPTSAATTMAPGHIVARKVIGKVTMLLSGTTSELHENDGVSQTATVSTGADSSVILVFSNGASTQLGADTTLVIEEFLQEPFQQDVSVGALTEEPTTSRTKLRLSKGELLGKVAHLKHEQGSYFNVQTPVGAAGIRGTTFRIVFRPTGTGQAFAVFSLSTLEGNVNFQQGEAGQPPAAPGTPQPPTPGTPTTPGQPAATSGGVPVVSGQEVVVTVSVEVNAQTNTVTVTAPPTITTTQPISLETQASLVHQAETLATTAATTTFTPTPSNGSSSSSGSTTEKKDENKSDKSKDSGAASGGDTSGTSSSGSTSSGATSSDSSSSAATETSSGSTSGPTSDNTGSGGGNSSSASGAKNGNAGQSPGSSFSSGPASPGPASNLPVLTPGAGKAPGS